MTRRIGLAGAMTAAMLLCAVTGAGMNVAPILPAEELRAPRGVRIVPVRGTHAGEIFFAYGRISPDGRHLAYTSMVLTAPPRRNRMVTVIDVTTGDRLFSHPGLDAYWSPDGQQFIFMNTAGTRDSVSIVRLRDLRLFDDVAPAELGDYLSWGRRGATDVVATILGNYYYLDGVKAVLPARRIKECEFGFGERPLISRTGQKVSIFVEGQIVVRRVDDCDDVVATGVDGAKADFSPDDRFIAFHKPKARAADGFEIAIVDLVFNELATLSLEGSAYYPTWTADGRLCFQYESDTFSGFAIASGIDSLPRIRIAPRPLPGRVPSPAPVALQQIFPEAAATERFVGVVVWAPWNAHSIDALMQLQAAEEQWKDGETRFKAFAAVVPDRRDRAGSEVIRTLSSRVPQLHLPAGSLDRTGAQNQVPAVLLFDRGVLKKRLLGAQSSESLLRHLNELEKG
ncbi:MAG: hypothetical protein ACRD3G_02680 [Vicinamibacterales bacterium]